MAAQVRFLVEDVLDEDGTLLQGNCALHPRARCARMAHDQCAQTPPWLSWHSVYVFRMQNFGACYKPRAQPVVIFCTPALFCVWRPVHEDALLGARGTQFLATEGVDPALRGLESRAPTRLQALPAVFDTSTMCVCVHCRCYMTSHCFERVQFPNTCASRLPAC